MDEAPLLQPRQGSQWTPPPPPTPPARPATSGPRRRFAVASAVLTLAVVALLHASKSLAASARDPRGRDRSRNGSDGGESDLLLRGRNVADAVSPAGWGRGRGRSLSTFDDGAAVAAAAAAVGQVARGASWTEDVAGAAQEPDIGSCDELCCSELLLLSSFRDQSRANAPNDPIIRNLQTNNSSTVCPTEPPSVTSNLPKAVTWILVVLLVCLSALFSGLTLGLMGLDKTGLEIVMEGDDPDASRAARRIYPVRSDGNRLLCTLLLGNVAVNALLSILMADIAGGLAGFLVSTAVIVVFGEILPQALCSRYALQIGSRTVPLIKVIMFVMWPLAAPLGWALDKLLGHELGTTYSKAEMTKLLEIHVKEGRFNAETGTAMTGALKYQDVKVKEVMTPLEHAYMLSADERLGYDTISEIFKTGYSRIPVYEVSVNNIIGLLFTKDLIFIDPEDETPVRSFVDIFGRSLHVVWPDDRLGDVLRDLKQGHSHMALVRDVNNEDETQDPFYEIKGIITLEDIIEVILGDEIVDETDAFVDASHSIKVDRSSADFDWARLRLLDAKLVDETLAEEEVRAVTAHLRTNYSDAVSLLSDRQLQRLVAETPVTELQAAEQQVGEDLPKDLLYEKDAPADVCTLLLGGKVTVLAGADNFRADVSSWSVLAPMALTDPKFAPDFTAYVSSGPCRCLRFARIRFMAAVDASAAEKFGHRPPAVVPPAAVAVAAMDGATGTANTGRDGSQHQERTPNHSVTVDMDRKDVVIGLPKNDVVIDVEDFDQVKITKGAAAETGEGTGGVSMTCDEDDKVSKVTFHVVETQETTVSQRTDARSDVAGEAVAKRETERKLKRRHRSKMLAAFMKKKSSASSDVAREESIASDAPKEASASGRKEDRPAYSPSHTASSQSASPPASKPSPDASMMSPLQAKLTDGGSYVPKPCNVSQVAGSSSISGSTRNRSGSFQHVESSSRTTSSNGKEQ